MFNFLRKKRIPCEIGTAGMAHDQVVDMLKEIPDWNLNQESTKISRNFSFPDFVEAMKFVNKVADLAETQQHHPDIYIHYNKVLIESWTHTMNGLSEKDFALAVQIDAL
jgi:4a-hydroxytetrahydrobiopterin dehydratase